jgi:hypothetical protein
MHMVTKPVTFYGIQKLFTVFTKHSIAPYEFHTLSHAIFFYHIHFNIILKAWLALQLKFCKFKICLRFFYPTCACYMFFQYICLRFETVTVTTLNFQIFCLFTLSVPEKNPPTLRRLGVPLSSRCDIHRREYRAARDWRLRHYNRLNCWALCTSLHGVMSRDLADYILSLLKELTLEEQGKLWA